MPFPPTQPPVRTLWAPSPIYEPGNPRQRTPLLQLYNRDRNTGTTRSSGNSYSSGRRIGPSNGAARYAYTRDLTNVLRGTTPRMIWDYQAESMTLSEEEQEYDLQLEAAKNYGFSWMVPEGKAMNQEEEADDEAINEETRTAAAAAVAAAAVAAAQEHRDRHAAALYAGTPAVPRQADEDMQEDVEDSMEGTWRRVRTSRRAGRASAGAGVGNTSGQAATAASGVGSRTSRRGGRPSGERRSSARQASTATGAGPRGTRPPNSRDSVGESARAPPRTSGRYSVSSAGSGGGSGSAAFPRYTSVAGGRSSNGSSGPSSVPMTTGPGDLSTGSFSGGGGAGGIDLDAEIPEAEEASYGDHPDASGLEQSYEGPYNPSEDLDANLTDLDDPESPQYSPPSPPFSTEENHPEPEEMTRDSVDMDVSS